MISIQSTVVELIGAGELKPMKKGGFLFSAFCKDLEEGWTTYIRMVVFDDELARYLNENTSDGSRVRITGKLKSDRYTPKSGLLQKKKKPRKTYEIVVDQATVLPKE